MLPLEEFTVIPSLMIETVGVTPKPRSAGNGTMPMTGPEPSASKVQPALAPTEIEMVAVSWTNAHAKTASTGYS